MKSESRYHKETYGFYYRGLSYEVVDRIKDSEIIPSYYCAYFSLDTSKLYLLLNLKGDIEVDVDDLPLSIFSASRFLGSKEINEIERVAHFSFTFAEVENITRLEGENLINKEFVKLGVDYNHVGDEDAEHTIESVCEDCEKVIDKIHNMGMFKEVKNED